MHQVTIFSVDAVLYNLLLKETQMPYLPPSLKVDKITVELGCSKARFLLGVADYKRDATAFVILSP